MRFSKVWVQDALRAYDLGLAGVVLSNHGGRQLDFARSGIEVLVEVVVHLKEKRGLSFPNEKFQLFVDGGVRRATDVIKAVALGATAGNVFFLFYQFLFIKKSNLINRMDCSWYWTTIDIRFFILWSGWC